MQNTRRMKQVVYKLKRQYAHPITVYHPTDKITDITTGTRKDFYSVTPIKKAAVLPAKLRVQKTNEAERRSWSSFYDHTTCSVIIDGRDLSFELTSADFIDINQERYSITDVRNAEDGVSYYVEGTSSGVTGEITCYSLTCTTNSIIYGEATSG